MRKKSQHSDDGQRQLDGMPAPALPHPIDAALKRVPFVRALEVEPVAMEAISRWHQERWYEQPKIIYIFADKPPKAGNKVALATVRKVGGLNAFLFAHNELEITKDQKETSSRPGSKLPDRYNRDSWNHQLNEDQRLALIDHELQHIHVVAGDDKIIYGLDEHDVEEFLIVVDRHGCWEPGLLRLKELINRRRA